MPPFLSSNHNANNPELGYRTTQETFDPLTEPDEYGTELHEGARVWKVYVKEADKHDGDLVKSWNDSADVILVFAALFSAISGAFLIESSKLLQQDPLLVISQTLLVIANGTQLPGSPPTPSDNSTEFTPSRTAIWVNTLWYLSLSLSLATSFVAILDKDWCHSFMKDRTGSHFHQTIRRQQKWDMIVRWKMSELLTFLPSLIHVALLLFAIGLCIMLWDTHVVVAIPVICVSGVAFGFYISSSIAASLVDSFPYPTIVSRIYRTELRQLLWQLLCELPFVLGLILSQAAERVTRVLAIYVIWIPLLLIRENFSSRDSDVDSESHTSTPAGQGLLRRALLFTRGALSFAKVEALIDWVGRNTWVKLKRSVIPWIEGRMPTVQQGLRDAGFRVHKWRPTANDNANDEPNQRDQATGRALSWLITQCEEPQSVDIALQSIAGGTSAVSPEPLVECKAALQILRRLGSSNLYRGQAANSEAAVSLYMRALSFPDTSAKTNSSMRKEGGMETGELIWNLQATTEKKVAELIEKDRLEPTKNNVRALRIGSNVASTILKILHNEPEDPSIAATFDSIYNLLNSHFEGSDRLKLHDAALTSLAHAASLLLLFAPTSIPTRHNRSYPSQEPLSTSVNLSEAAVGGDHVDAHTLSVQFFKLANHSRFGYYITPLVNLATTCALLYYTLEDRKRCKNLTWCEAVVRGLIQTHSQGGWGNEFLKQIFSVELPGSAAPNELTKYFSGLSHKFMTTNRIGGTAARLESLTSDGSGKTTISAELYALHALYLQTPILSLDPGLYLGIVEVMCNTHDPSSTLYACGAQILSKCPFPTLSEDLVTTLEQRDLVSLLNRNSFYPDGTQCYFARGQLWLLLSLYIYADDTASGRDKLKVQLEKCCGSQYSERSLHWYLGGKLHWLHVWPGSTIARDLGVWAYRLEECVRQPVNDSRQDYIGEALRSVPYGLRGLSSCTAWPRLAGDPRTNERQGAEGAAPNVPENVNATNLAGQGEGATGGEDHSQGAGRAADAEEGARGGEDVGHGDPRQDREATSQGQTDRVGENIEQIALLGKIDEARDGENDGTLTVGGDERRAVDAGNATETTNGPKSEDEHAENVDAAQRRHYSDGDALIEMGRLEGRQDRSTSSI